jgi:hypothetical protein
MDLDGSQIEEPLPNNLILKILNPISRKAGLGFFVCLKRNYVG